MSSPSIQEKLGRELIKNITEESQVVYILSRIRKILEIDCKEKVYKKLKFFCDWALHKQIDNTEPLGEELDRVISNDDGATWELIGLKVFFNELRKFLKEYQIPYPFKTTSDEFRFAAILVEIYSDTPLIVRKIEKTEVVLKNIVRTSPDSPGYSLELSINKL